MHSLFFAASLRALLVFLRAIENIDLLMSAVSPVADRCLPVLQSFKLHIGANLPLPTRAGIVEAQPNSAAVPAQTLMAEAVTDYFEGLPLKRWAERLGERVMPTVELVKQEQKRAKAAAAELRSRAGEVAVPVVPSFLPFSRW